MITTVACVLRSGGDFRAEHVTRLYNQVRRFSSRDEIFVCLTDQPDEVFDAGCLSTRLNYGWPGWWSKIEVLGIPGPCLYLDLDVSIIGDLAPLIEVAQTHDFVACANFWNGDPHKINSSVMAWRGDAPRRLYDLFASAPERYMAKGQKHEYWGDQGFIAEHYGGEIETWQALLPGHVVSYKRGCLKGEDVSNMRICCSHGSPRPWERGGADDWLARRG